MVQEELKSTFNESVEIRERIQNELREDYKELKKLVELVATSEVLEGNVFKFLVDMYHYRYGGYPKPTSPAKHIAVMVRFANLVRLVDFLELDDFLLVETYGIKVEITNPIQDFEITGDMLETIRNRGYTGKTFKEFLMEALLRGDNIQSDICSCSDQIKDKGKELEETASIKKKHYTGAVMKEYQRREAAKKDEKQLAKVEERIDEEYESYTRSMGLLENESEEEA